MNLRTTDLRVRALYGVVIVVAVASFVVSQGQTVVSGSWDFNPRLVFGFLATVLLIVVALGQLFVSDQSVQEGWTLTHIAVASVLALYLLAGVALLLSGFTGWVVLGNLAIPIVAGIAFWIVYGPE